MKIVGFFSNGKRKGMVSEMDNRIVGFSIVDLIEKKYLGFICPPEFEKRGIGKQLHDIMLDWYFNQTEENVWLGTAPNTRAESFYRKAGWRDIGFHGKGEIKFEMSYQIWKESQIR